MGGPIGIVSGVIGFSIFALTALAGGNQDDGYLVDCLSKNDISEITEGLKPPTDLSGDWTQLRDFQKKFKPEDCLAARNEMTISKDSNFIFFEGKGLLTSKESLLVDNLLTQSYKAMDPAVWGLKNAYLRQRPFQLYSDTLVCGPINVQGTSYPSGHAAISVLEAHILSELFPERRGAFFERAQEIGVHRILLGAHFPSDVWAGQEIGRRTFLQLKECEKFKERAAETKALISGP